MSFLKVGFLSDYLNTKIVIILLAQFILVVTFLGYRSWSDSSVECISCHGNKEKLLKLGYPQFYVTQEMVEKESNHPNVKCHECHLGNGRAKDADTAHKSMLKGLLINNNGLILGRKESFPFPLIPKKKTSANMLLPENIPELRNILWHDREPKTLGFDPEFTEKTCSKAGCHAQELKQFKQTIMGTNHRQRTMRTWTKPYGPHNCGPSFADLQPPEKLIESSFSFKNTEEIRLNLNLPFTKEQAMAKQKFCNVCHAGCLDCHYSPDREKGVHAFIKKPVSNTCMGNGRGTSMCHTGSMGMRRGETFIKGDFTEPPGRKSDVHYEKGIHCIDCHQTGIKGMGDIQRKATCQDCHIEIEDAHSESIHKNLYCATCHVNELSGYQITVWGPGLVAGKPNPFKKYSYYGIQKSPIIMKDQKGKWMPVKIWPHSVGNIKEDVKPSEKVLFRWPDGETRDAYYVAGTFDSLSKNNKHLLWIEIEQASHPYSKARKCNSCHKKEQQIAVSTWEFFDDQGAEPFKGTYKIIADADGLRITDLKNTTPVKVIQGYSPENFASWLFLKDAWKAPGDFSIKTDKAKYQKALRLSDSLEAKLRQLDEISKSFDKKKLRQHKKLKGAALHNEEDGRKLLN